MTDLCAFAFPIDVVSAPPRRLDDRFFAAPTNSVVRRPREAARVFSFFKATVLHLGHLVPPAAADVGVFHSAFLLFQLFATGGSSQRVSS